MAEHKIETKLNELNRTDVYSMILFGLYKLQGVSEYSTLSELPFILDRTSLHNLLEYYGGMTIKIPTKQELEDMLNALLLYQLTKLDKIPYEEALKELKQIDCRMDVVLNIYNKLDELLLNYDFKRV